MKEIETNDKKKSVKKDSRALITFGMAYLLLVVIVAIDNSTVIYSSDLAVMGLTLLLLGIFLPGLIEIINKVHEKLEQKKYDTGTLAQIETEA